MMFSLCSINRSTASLTSLSSQRNVSSLDASKLTKELTQKPKAKAPYETLKFGQTFTDHMVEVAWTKNEGWGVPRLSPYHALQLDPASSVFHYGLECFEGMKAYQDKSGRTRLFRPMENMKRMNSSCSRILLPQFEGDQWLQCIKELLRVDKSWIPGVRGFSLYLRPTMIATQEWLGVGQTQKALLYTIACPVGPYYPTGFEPVSLLADTVHSRAWPGGCGAFKLGGNYAPTIAPQAEAAAKKYQQVLWLFGNEHFLTEVGTMNLFVFLINEKGQKELVTPPLDGTILPGVTRMSILDLARQWGEFIVSERPIRMQELLNALSKDRLLEVFGSGTACVVSPVNRIGYQGVDYVIPLDRSNPSAKAGPLALRFSEEIQAIQYGEKPSPWSVVVD